MTNEHPDEKRQPKRGQPEDESSQERSAGAEEEPMVQLGEDPGTVEPEKE